MKNLILALVILALSAPLFAQSATLNTPEAGITATTIKVTGFTVSAACTCAQITISYQDGSSNEKRSATYSNEPAGAFLTAITTVRSGETGTLQRKLNFRILGFLVDNNELTGVTLVP